VLITAGEGIRFQLGATSVFPYREAGSGLNDGAWHHVVAVRDEAASLLRLYIDGESVGTATDTTTGSLQNNDDISVGNSGVSYTSNDFTGDIDEIRLYDRLLTDAEVAELYAWAPGPVGYWNFDEQAAGDGNVVADNSGGGNGGTLDDANVSGMDCGAPGKYGSACAFDGADDHINVAGLFGSPRNITVSGWFNLETNQQGELISVGNTVAIRVNANNTTLRGFYYDGSSWQGTDQTQTYHGTGWHHVAYTINDLTDFQELYLDGVRVATSTHAGSPTYNQGADTTIGKHATLGSGFWDGLLDEVRVYNYVRSSQQIIEDMNAGHPAGGSPVSSKLVELNFDEGYGDTVHDTGLSGADGDIGGSGEDCSDGGATCPSWTNDGVSGKALSFDGGDYVGLGDAAAVDFADGQDFTLSQWVKFDNFSSIHTILAKKSGNAAGNTGYMINVGTAATPNFYAADGTDQYWRGAGYKFEADTWYHLVFVYDESDANASIFYVNGEAQTVGGTSGTITSVNSLDSANALYYGQESDNQYGLTGDLDEIKIYNYALTPDEIIVDYQRSASATLGSGGTDSSGNPSNAGSREYCVPGDGNTCNPPIAEWKFDENTGTVINDTSGNRHTGTVTGSPEWVSGKVGSALEFTRTVDQITVGNLSAAPGATGTLTMWIKPDSFTGSELYSLFSKAATDNDRWIYRIRENGSGQWKQELATSPDTVGNWTSRYSSTNLSAGQWQFVGFTFNSNQIRFYLNGRADGVQTATITTLSNSDSGYINTADSNGFGGVIDQIRIYDYVRTPAQMAWDYNRGGPVAWWQFDECQGTTAYDNSGNGYNGTITPNGSGNTSAGTCGSGTGTEMWNDGTSGRFNGSLGFDGTNDVVVVNDQPVFTTSTQMSWAAWIKVSSDVTGLIMNKYDTTGNQRSWSLSYWAGGLINTNFSSDGTSYQGVTSKPSITLNEWHHVVSVYNAGNNDIYIDGVLDTSGVSSQTSLYNNTTNVTIGASNAAGASPFPGQIDDARIYNYPLTAVQVKELAAGGAVRFE
jgi:hypothetical protein